MDDLISRQAAIEAALTYLVEYCGAAFDEDMQRMLKERLDSLPSAQPEPHEGHWIGGDGSYICSECNGSPMDFIEFIIHIFVYITIVNNFFPKFYIIIEIFKTF